MANAIFNGGLKWGDPNSKISLVLTCFHRCVGETSVPLPPLYIRHVVNGESREKNRQIVIISSFQTTLKRSFHYSQLYHPVNINILHVYFCLLRIALFVDYVVKLRLI